MFLHWSHPILKRGVVYYSTRFFAVIFFDGNFYSPFLEEQFLIFRTWISTEDLVFLTRYKLVKTVWLPYGYRACFVFSVEWREVYLLWDNLFFLHLDGQCGILCFFLKSIRIATFDRDVMYGRETGFFYLTLL